ncbi:MAG: hypothetical protein OXP09_13140 [Gammaproteobacteria bacterium]|nr:hypothetical protein [Gammaproteobacteria bacterium]MDE0366508.1 hypothetical protein [Gammaproteobacteria bacterium]
MTNEKLLLVGSVPFESAEQVLHMASDMLGGHLDSIPDGEVLDRRFWILRMAFQVFNGHAAFETLHRPAAPPGEERLIPAGLDDVWRFRLRPGIEKVGFDMPGWRLGYAKDAQNSYAIFKAMKRDGKVPGNARFQVSLPAVNSVCNPSIFGADEAELAIIRTGFQEAMVAEARKVCEVIPPSELAVQFDCSFEITDVYGGTGLPIEGSIARNVKQFEGLSEAVADDALLGFHLCFGTFGGWPRFAPDDLGRTVELANAIKAASLRRIDWIHMPALDTTEEAFYAPLADLALGDTRVFLGMIHSMESFEARYRVARKFVSEFGLGAYCGLGRLEAGQVEGVFSDHLRAIEIAGEVHAGSISS